MERMTVRQGDVVYLSKDGELLPPALMSSFDIRMALMKLADYEDKEEERLKEFKEMYEQGKFDGIMDYIYRNKSNGVIDIYPDIEFNENESFKLKLDSGLIHEKYC